MATTWETVRGVLKTADVAIRALEVIQSITKLGGTPAAEILVAIDGIVQGVLDAHVGTVTPADADNAIQSIGDKLRANDSQISKELDDKFGPNPGG